MTETPIVFACRDVDLLGVAHDPGTGARRGVIIVVGGPQYRAGSHRQYVLLARSLAAAGIPVFRFDYRGLGDSGGDYLGFEHIGDDIAAAIEAFTATVPGVEEVVLWGLCDAASAIVFYAPHDPRVGGIVLLNPWARTEATLARTYLKHYYIRRLSDRTFWRKVLAGGLNPLEVVRSLAGVIAQAFGVGETAAPATATAPWVRSTLMPAPSADPRPLPERMAHALRRYTGPVLLIMSGNDLTAREFDEIFQRSRRWRRVLTHRRITRTDLPHCDHTFSRREWRDAVATTTRNWLLSN